MMKGTFRARDETPGLRINARADVAERLTPPSLTRKHRQGERQGEIEREKETSTCSTHESSRISEERSRPAAGGTNLPLQHRVDWISELYSIIRQPGGSEACRSASSKVLREYRESNQALMDYFDLLINKIEEFREMIWVT
ncbi:hypothetical protein QLX08_007041 [Tetragonisca angustula]|uniref:Uncharacterized protein n=1 Tax=Tetragonisca angustula TaxID=166442 RepID=A0AAW0ZR82_9HYME